MHHHTRHLYKGSTKIVIHHFPAGPKSYLTSLFSASSYLNPIFESIDSKMRTTRVTVENLRILVDSTDDVNSCRIAGLPSPRSPFTELSPPVFKLTIDLSSYPLSRPCSLRFVLSLELWTNVRQCTVRPCRRSAERESISSVSYYHDLHCTPLDSVLYILVLIYMLCLASESS